MRPRMDAAARRSGSMLARSLWMLGRIPVGSVNLCDRGDADGRADKERGWTRRGREPRWTRSGADSISWVAEETSEALDERLRER